MKFVFVKKCFTNYDEEEINFISSSNVNVLDEEKSEKKITKQEDSFDEEDSIYLFE